MRITRGRFGLPARYVGLLALAPLGSLAAQTTPPTPEVLLQEGGMLPDGSPILDLHGNLFEVADGGHWAAFVSSSPSWALVRDGIPLVRGGDVPPGFPELMWLGVLKIDVNDEGRVLWHGFAWEDADGSGDYDPYGGDLEYWTVSVDDELVLRSGDLSIAPELPGAVYQELRDVAWIGTRRFVFHGLVLDPTVFAVVDALIEVELDASGYRVAERLRHKERAVLPGQTAPLGDIAYTDWRLLLSPPFGLSADDLEHILYTARTTEPRDLLVLEETVLAEEGGPSPVAGRAWTDLYENEHDVNNQGSTVFRGRVDGDAATSFLVVKDGAVFRQAGDPIYPGATETILRFHQGSLSLADNGDLLWYTEWDDGVGGDNLGDGGFLVNDELVIQEGVTTVNGDLVWELNGHTHGGRISDDARWVVAQVDVTTGTTTLETLVRLDRGPRAVASRRSDLGINALCFGSDQPLVGGTWTYTLDATGTFASLEGMVVRAGRRSGIVIPAGEVLIGGLKYLAIYGAASSGQNSYMLGIPMDVSLIGVEGHAQGFLLGSVPGLVLCNAADLVLSDR